MDSFILQAVALAALIIFLWAIRRRLRRTSFNNLPGPPAKSWIFGSLAQLRDRNAWDFHRQVSETYGEVSRVKGLLGVNGLYVYDPKALNHVLVKEQEIYEETEGFIQSNLLAFGGGFFASVGERHRLHRKMLNPVFSIAHMREMVPIFYEIAHKLQNTLMSMTSTGPREVNQLLLYFDAEPHLRQIDILAWNTRLALELIGQTGLGYSFDTLEEGATPHPYGVASKFFMPLTSGFSIIVRDIMAPLVVRYGSPRIGRFLASWVPWKKLHQFRDVMDTLNGTALEILEEKKKAIHAGDEVLKTQVGRGKDIMSILLKSNMNALDADRLTDDELTGQISSLTFAATDTTSSALSRILYLLSVNKDCQDRAREEIKVAKEDNGGQDIDYDTLVSLPFLDAVCRETLRLYPPLPFLQRTTRADTVLPLATPVKGINGEDIRELPLPTGTPVFVSVISSNTNPRLWGPDSYKWRPERWLTPLPESLINARIPGVYSHLLMFIGGGRSCIGFKFSQLEMKVALALLLEKLEFTPSNKHTVWQMSAVALPHPDFESIQPRLPIVISRAD
ncbi:unnamed protein product [Cyclocybe aegerita]|uniref:Cytochrome P450 n=1 Tax=Cyclocybe aegerita TaxID=1973307 RepID=A0A8S0VZL1_CYCAE|nr:unnamed protein product [Cyclocybe aegerita]